MFDYCWRLVACVGYSLVRIQDSRFIIQTVLFRLEKERLTSEALRTQLESIENRVEELQKERDVGTSTAEHNVVSLNSRIPQFFLKMWVLVVFSCSKDRYAL